MDIESKFLRSGGKRVPESGGREGRATHGAQVGYGRMKNSRSGTVWTF